MQEVRCSIVVETEAILPEGAPLNWNKRYLNMMVSGITKLSPKQLLKSLKNIESSMGRVFNKEKWAPRIIDLDILFYYDLKINTCDLFIPHPEIKNRDFIKHLLFLMGVDFFKNEVYKNSFLKSFILHPRLVGILNYTQDSFSDVGKFYQIDKAISHAVQLVEDSANNY